MNTIKEMVKNKQVSYLFYREKELWYTTECGFEFPVPIDDVGTAAMNRDDKAIYFMRWIRKQVDRLNQYQEDKAEFEQQVV